MPELTGKCLCGEASYSFTVDQQLNTHVCHCNRCRHLSGALCATTVDLPKTYKPDAQLIDKLVAYKSSPPYTRYFCSTCGCHVLERDERFGRWRVCQGTLNNPEEAASINGHVFVEDTKDGGCSDWVSFVKNQKIKRWNGFPDESSEVPDGWHISEQTPIDNQAPVHAHCDCKGVTFYVSRPSEISKQTDGPCPDVLDESPQDKMWWLRQNHTKFLAGVCVCDSCRLATGSEMIEWAFVPTANIHLSQDCTVPFSRSFGSLKTYRSSDEASRHFCGTCGATVFWIGDARPTLIDIAVGLLDAPEGARAESLLEWRTERVSFREDAIKRVPAFTTALEAGITAWRHAQESKQRH